LRWIPYTKYPVDIPCWIGHQITDRKQDPDRALREVFGSIVKRLEFDPLATELVREQDGQQVLEITKEMVETSQQQG